MASVTHEDIWQLLTADDHHPATDAPIVLDLADIGYTDGDPQFWSTCEVTLTRKLEALFAEHGGLQRAAHLSVFALAPMPVLMVLGKILGDVRPATVYQYDRFGGSWKWLAPEPAAPRAYSHEVAAAKGVVKDVALVIELSAAIDRDLVAAAMGQAPHATVTFTSPDRGYSLIRGPHDLAGFHAVMRAGLNEIEQRFGSDCTLHVFPAMPASTAVQFGRLLLPKASANVRIYDHHALRGGFTPTVWLIRRIEKRDRRAARRENAAV